MHRLVQDHLEDVLSGTLPAGHQALVHLKECGECQVETVAMRAHNEIFQAFRGADVEPRPGFYARVLERIELQRPVSIWALFTDSVFGRRLAIASLAIAVFMGTYVVSSEQGDRDAMVASAVEMDPLYPDVGFAKDVMAANPSDNGTVFMSLVSYQER